MKPPASIEDLHRLARRRVPRAFADYADAGSYGEHTLRANRADLDRLAIEQRVLVNMAKRDLSVSVLGERLPLPLIVAPLGLLGMQHGDGEILACRAAQAAGIPFTLSTMSVCSIEDVAGAVDRPFWFQLYVMRDRGFMRSLIERAIAARCSALVVTVDLQVLATRHADARNGLSVPPSLGLANLIDMARRPRWLFSILRGKRRSFGNLDGHVAGMEGVRTLSEWTARQFDQALSWQDIAWIKGLWPGKLVLKGIMHAEDARRAVAAGADAIVVSNHGGRQLDGAASSISRLPGIADAVGADAEILFDGGIRSGVDIVRALALGARACLIGRAIAWGVGAAGEAGAARAIEILRGELDVTMALAGIERIAGIGRDALVADG